MNHMHSSNMQINTIIDKIIKKAKTNRKTQYQTLNLQNNDLPLKKSIDEKYYKSFLSWLRPSIPDYKKGKESRESQQLISRLFSAQKEVSFIDYEGKIKQKKSSIKLKPVKQKIKKQPKNAYFSNKIRQTECYNTTSTFRDKHRVTSINYLRANNSAQKSSTPRKLSQFYLTTRDKQRFSFNVPISPQKDPQHLQQPSKSFLYKTFYR